MGERHFPCIEHNKTPWPKHLLSVLHYFPPSTVSFLRLLVLTLHRTMRSLYKVYLVTLPLTILVGARQHSPLRYSRTAKTYSIEDYYQGDDFFKCVRCF